MKNIAFTLFLALALSWPLASSNAAGPRVTEQEKAVFAFFKLGNRAPAYGDWVLESEIFKHADGKDKNDVYEDERLRLKWGYNVFDLEKDVIRIDAKVKLKITTTNGKPALKIAFAGHTDPENPYFPYLYRNEWIALSVIDLYKFITLNVDDKTFEDIRTHMVTNQTSNAVLKMRVRAKSAEWKEPTKIDGLDFWTMTGDLAYLSLKSNADDDAKTFYTYSAPWYLSASEKELLDLLQ